LDPEILTAVQSCAESKKSADGTTYLSLSPDQTRLLANHHGTDKRKIEITALENGIIPERYARNIKTLSAGDQIRLLKSNVCIVGLGGLGGSVTEILARIGVGTLTLIDGDVFEASNLNRQLMSLENLLDVPKAGATAERVGQINSTVKVRAFRTFLSDENADPLIADSDVVVDCLDNVKTRFILEDAAKKMGKPLVSAAVAGVFGQVTTIFPEDSGLKQVYGDREKAANKGAEAYLGNLPTIVSLIASLECAEVIKVLLKRKEILRNKMLIVDLSDNTFDVMQLG